MCRAAGHLAKGPLAGESKSEREGVIGIEYQLESRLDLRASPALIAASEMLELPSHALESVVQEALDQNPALERLDAAECAVCQDRWPTRCPVCSPPGAPSPRAGASGVAATHPGLDRSAPQTDADALLAMVRMAVRASLVGSLDQHGRLDQEPSEMATALGTDESAVCRVLSAVRQNGPPGVGATSAAECLLLQLDSLELVDDAARTLARRVIAGHLPALARGHFAVIASALDVDQQSVTEVLRLIRERLRPYPAFEGHAPQPNARIIPDLVIRERPEAGGEFEVELVEPRRLRLGIAPGYQRRLNQPRHDEASQLRGLLAEARHLLGQLRDRWETLRLVATCTVERQKDFVREGPSGLQPLTRAEVAETLGLHQSTVSRATAGKYAMLPSHRIVPMAAFYSASGGLADELRRIVAAEDRRPLSDGELADRLRAQGYAIARRTVTKYRIKLGIAAAAQR
jgi:RNA polymerase sigma-54 factor